MTAPRPEDRHAERLRRLCDNNRSAEQELEDRVAGGMADLQFVGGGDELAAVPEADCGLNGQKICK